MHSLTAAAFILATSQATACLAQDLGLDVPVEIAGRPHIQTGVITVVDSATMSFACQDAAGSRFYWVSRATRFRWGRADASFFALRTGQPVEVISHDSGRLEIADVVDF